MSVSHVCKVFFFQSIVKGKSVLNQDGNHLFRSVNLHILEFKGPGKLGHFVADTMLPTQMFPRLSVRTTFVAGTNFVSGTQKMFLIVFRNILYPQQI